MRNTKRVKTGEFLAVLGLIWIWTAGPSEAQVSVIDPQVLVSQATPSPNPPGQDLEAALVDISAMDAPSLHTVNNNIKVGTPVRSGQGIIIDSTGIIVTNNHIIGNPQHILVKLSSGQVLEAKILKATPPDLCLIKIDAPYALQAVTLADTSEIAIGSNVIAVTNANFNLQRVRGGQIIRIYTQESTHKMELMEMNIPLRPGDSGGPVLNQQGSLVGVIMGNRLSDPAKSYAISVNQIRQAYTSLRSSLVE